MCNSRPLRKNLYKLQLRKTVKVASRGLQVDNSADLAEVCFFTEAEKLLSAFDLLAIEDFRGARVPIKLHMGEPGNRYYIHLYTPQEVQLKLTEHREAIARAESEIRRLREYMANRSFSAIEAELLRQELKALRDRNLWESTVEERADLVAKLGIRILPSKDLKSGKIPCRSNLAKVNEERGHARFAKVTFGGP